MSKAVKSDGRINKLVLEMCLKAWRMLRQRNNMADTFTKVIDDPKAPERLRGRAITAIITRPTSNAKGSLQFQIELPDDMTGQEKGYVDWLIGEYVDHLREKFPRLIGDRRS